MSEWVEEREGGVGREGERESIREKGSVFCVSVQTKAMYIIPGRSVTSNDLTSVCKNKQANTRSHSLCCVSSHAHLRLMTPDVNVSIV